MGVLINRKHGKLIDFLLRFTPLRLDYKKVSGDFEKTIFHGYRELLWRAFVLTGEANLLYSGVQYPLDPSTGCLVPSRIIIPFHSIQE